MAKMTKARKQTLEWFRTVRGGTAFGAVLDPARDAVEEAIIRTQRMTSAFKRLDRADRNEAEELYQKVAGLKARLIRLEEMLDKVDRIMEEVERESPRIAAKLEITEAELDA